MQKSLSPPVGSRPPHSSLGRASPNARKTRDERAKQQDRAARKPDTSSVQRATMIKAPPEKVFPLINDFHQWVSWSPYENKDPAMKRTYNGAESGKGAVYAWEGTKNVGSGRMEILETIRAIQNRHQTRFLYTVRGPQHRGVHNAAAGRCHQSDMDDARSSAVHGEDHAWVHQHRPHGRQGF